MRVADFDYRLPPALIAQEPAARRDESRLLVLERSTGAVHDARFPDIRNWLRDGDLLVLNDTRVIPARLFGRLPTGGRLELLLLRELETGTWEALTRPARKARPGTRVALDGYVAEVTERRPDGARLVRFEPADARPLMTERGEYALPPYIRKKYERPARYQTVYAERDGAVAAPTAGLHFTPELLAELERMGVEQCRVTLHAGLGTFRPVKVDRVEDHTMHEEWFELGEKAARMVNEALEQGRRVVCVGTTTVRTLEGQADRVGQLNGSTVEQLNVPEVRVRAGSGMTKLYVYPGYDWKVTGALLTNFHLPKSTLLMLVSAFAGRDRVLAAYRHAIEQRYRFYSFGDAMLIV